MGPRPLHGDRSRRLPRAAAPLLDRADRLLDRAVAAVGDASRTVKFLRGRAHFVPRADDVYVASYPRSGTTWTQLVVHLLVSGARSYDFEHICRVAPWWERSLAWRSEAAAELDRLPGPRVFKSHLVYRWLPPVGRCIYVRRDPADVALSYYDLYRRYLRFDGSFAEFFERFVRGEVQYGAWFDHVAAWEAHQDDPRVLFCEYEAMRRDPRAAADRIARFLGVAAPAARLDEVVRHSGIEAMKAHEAKFDHVGELCLQWGIRDGAFIGAGRVGRGGERLSEEQRRRLADASGRPPSSPHGPFSLPAFLH